MSATAQSSPSDVRQSVSTLRANDRQRCVRAAVKSVGAASNETRSAKRTFTKGQGHAYASSHAISRAIRDVISDVSSVIISLIAFSNSLNSSTVMIMSGVISDDVISVRLLELAELEHAAPVHVEGLEADADCHNNNERDGRCEADHST